MCSKSREMSWLEGDARKTATTKLRNLSFTVPSTMLESRITTSALYKSLQDINVTEDFLNVGFGFIRK